MLVRVLENKKVVRVDIGLPSEREQEFLDRNPTGGFKVVEFLPESIVGKWVEVNGVIIADGQAQAEYDSKQYQRDRAVAYPSLEEQADMAYWDRQNGTTTLDDAISAVKAQFPKGE